MEPDAGAPFLNGRRKKYRLSELYDRKLDGPDAEVLYGIEYGKEMDASQAMLDLDELLLPGYPRVENGYCNLPNGGAYVAVRPSDLFEKEQLAASPVVSIHGGGGVVVGQGNLPYVGLHHLRMIENGFEIRSRFWFGYTIKNQKLVFSNPEQFTLNPEFAYAYAHHVANEMTNLRTLLPAVWAAADH